MIHVVELNGVAPQPWRNGGGQTRELLAWPPDSAPGHWLLRVSVADVAKDGPFSPFPHVERWFAVLEGPGVALSFLEGQKVVTARSAPVRFDGAATPGCRILGGPTRDLNLMVRAGTGQSQMRAAVAGETLPIATRWQGLYAVSALQLQTGSDGTMNIPAGSLVWTQTPACRWTPRPEGDAPFSAWWLTLEHPA